MAGIGRNLFCHSTRCSILLLGGLLIGCGDSDDGRPGDDEAAQPARDAAAQPADDSTPPHSDTEAAPYTDAKQLLADMIAAYQSADSYRDDGVVQTSFVYGGRQQVGEQPFAASFQRPNRLTLDMYSTRLKSDGEKVYATIEGLGDQVVVVTAPETIVAPDFYGWKDLNQVVRLGIAGASVQLDLLTGDEPWAEVMQEFPTAKLADGGPVDGHDTYRVTLTSEVDRLELWIDKQSLVLRRLRFPTQEHVRMDPNLSEMSLVAEFKNAQLGPGVAAESFTWPRSDDEVYVRFPVQPPNDALKPSPLVGRPAPAFSFVAADGQNVDKQSLDGKVTVLDFWATWCRPCLDSLPKLSDIAANYDDNPQVAFYAVNTEARSEVSDERVGGALAAIRAHLPYLRLTDGSDAMEAFGIEGIPTAVILGPDGKVQYYQVGATPQFYQQLPKLIDALLAGESIADDGEAAWQAEQRRYQQELEFADADRLGDIVEIPRAEIAAASEPAHLKKSRVWLNDEMVAPGFVLPVAGPEALKLFAIDNWSSIVELDASGKIVARHDKAAVKLENLSYLRTTTNNAGERFFLVGGAGQPQIALADGDWRQLLLYPAEDTAAIFSGQFAPVGGEGAPGFVVGYLGPVGMQGVSLGGERLWRNRSIQNIGQIAVAPGAAPTILCTHELGTIARLDAEGAELEPFTIAGHAVANVAVDDLDGGDEYQLAALVVDGEGGRSLVGLTADGQVDWTYAIPPGEHTVPIEPLVSGYALADGKKCWIVAAADGSIHFVAGDGTAIDQFNYGQTITGIAAAPDAAQPQLWISTPQGLESLRFE